MIEKTPLDTIDNYKAYVEHYMSGEEKAKLSKLKSDQSGQIKSDMLWARIILKKIFAEQENVSLSNLKQIEILNSKSDDILGHPLLFYRGRRQNKFLSISHYDGAVGVSFSSSPCGIDIVKSFTAFPEKSFIEYALTPNEQRRLYSINTPQDRLRWINLVWGIKEAISKYLGCGLRYGPRTINIEYMPNETLLNFSAHPGIKLYHPSLNECISVRYYWDIRQTYFYIYVSQTEKRRA